jgi:hypothetical protein
MYFMVVLLYGWSRALLENEKVLARRLRAPFAPFSLQNRFAALKLLYASGRPMKIVSVLFLFSPWQRRRLAVNVNRMLGSLDRAIPGRLFYPDKFVVLERVPLANLMDEKHNRAVEHFHSRDRIVARVHQPTDVVGIHAMFSEKADDLFFCRGPERLAVTFE